ncbi:tRNA-dihydrouridine(20a/20b) synthase [NAD(P)+]-like [Aricia agestis]|uniref:tRNA-dihydrouridine(20a/20b) synthase [NAD(P)+]-like n=1 Tax=Aricia agestis TaxID=91739 RepID=UPI001C208D9B|nr:tRNA-dihydrouridine(20a/20b) synthase [NAD(P)+]-like [Aricia agestis]XP_041976341.1 tRNA-dihydrouridine(20a/20b) synthase [NAD(P)+]-like [Aricia agestis]XP_041976342.1 tRNA-dihydrouridine(20a/20b) synthase [NAD(P)+]-like [Aricia agestis]
MSQEISLKDLFLQVKNKNEYLKVCAPMVRYSRVQFRTLVKNYGVDLCFTPMILADSFCQNSKARYNEFLTTDTDSPLIVQFAANNANDFLDASKLVHPYANGVDLNCGCPQRWAMKDGYGCSLLSKPDIIQDLVLGVRNNLPSHFSVSVKIRILQDIKKTIELCHQLQSCGVDFITVHGRTPSQKSGEKVNVDALREVCASVQVPIIVNGGVKTLKDADDLYSAVKCNGVMAASGLLTNPALFDGSTKTPQTCIKLWMDLKNKSNDHITFQCYHHHLVFMLEKILTKPERQEFNCLSTFESVDEYLKMNILNDHTTPDYEHSLGNFIKCEFDEGITSQHGKKCRGCGKSTCYCICNRYDCDKTDGKYFSSFLEESDSLDYMETNMFAETL